MLVMRTTDGRTLSYRSGTELSSFVVVDGVDWACAVGDALCWASDLSEVQATIVDANRATSATITSPARKRLARIRLNMYLASFMTTTALRYVYIDLHRRHLKLLPESG
jgi:hypothetical protein